MTQVRKSKVFANHFAIFEMKDENDPERAREALCNLITKYTARRRQAENRERQHRSLAIPNSRKPVET
eukprot:11208104-Lingulodinium_polyedra.AAC.1